MRWAVSRETAAVLLGSVLSSFFSPYLASATAPSRVSATIVSRGWGPPCVTNSSRSIRFGPTAPGTGSPGGPNPDTRRATSATWPSNCSYRCERSASVVTVPITAHTTAISATDATTSRVRRVRGRGRRRRIMPRA